MARSLFEWTNRYFLIVSSTWRPFTPAIKKHPYSSYIAQATHSTTHYYLAIQTHITRQNGQPKKR